MGRHRRAVVTRPQLTAGAVGGLKRSGESADPRVMAFMGNPTGRRLSRTQSHMIRSDAENARAISRTKDEIYEAEERIDRLTLLCMAMWSLIEDETGLTEADLAQRVAEIDASDGTENGTHRPAADRCECGAAIAAGAARCQFCGVEAPPRSPFYSV